MQRWLEPPVQVKASYQDAGLMRGGVVENMAPLGTLPKPAVVRKPPVPGTEGGSGSTVKRIIFKKAAPSEDTPPSAEESPAWEPVDAGLTPTSRLSFPVPALDDEEDEDYVPKITRARRSAQNNRAVQSNAQHTVTRARRKSSARPSSPPIHTFSDSVHFQAPRSVAAREPEDKDLADRVVEEAVDEALRHYRYPTAWALRLLYDENQSDPQFVSMIEDIYHQRADSETQKAFSRLMSEKKREGKKDNKGCYYFVPPSTNSRFTPRKPKPAPYRDLLKMSTSGDKDDSDKADRHVSKRRKIEADGDALLGADAHGRRGASRVAEVRTHKSPRSRKKRTGSTSSTSSLSSVPDDFPDNYDEFMDQVDGELGVSRPSTGAPNAPEAREAGHEPTTPAPPAAQPIGATTTTQQKQATAKKRVAPPVDAPDQNTTTTQHHPHDPSMPAAVLANGSHLHNHANPLAVAPKFASRFGGADEPDGIINRIRAKKARTAGLTQEASADSFARHSLSVDGAIEEPIEEESSTAPAAARIRSSQTPALSSRGARAARRNHDDLGDPASPAATSVRPEHESPWPAPHSSRAATPANLRSNKRGRPGLRVKTS